MGCPNARQISNYWVNDGAKVVLIILWVLANLALIGERLWYYLLGDGFKYTAAISYAIPVARSSAAALRLNSALILLPALRNFNSWMRGTPVGNVIPFDKFIVFHIYIGWSIALFSAMSGLMSPLFHRIDINIHTSHVGAHFVNAYNIAYVAVPQTLAQLGVVPAGTAPPSPWEFAFLSLPGWTGVAITISMLLMFTTAVKAVRGPEFETFWFTHHFFVVYFIAASLHGFAQLLEKAQFWMWVVGPILFYIIERGVRIYRGSQKTIVLQAVQHPSRVLELRLQKPTFKYKPGEYVFLQCPYIADYEWHPFTISSAYNEGYIGIHMRIVGDWTGKVYKLLNPKEKLGLVQSHMVTAPNGKPIFLIDGPFGAASDRVFHYDTLMLWSAGIGVTPFAAILKAIKHEIEQGACKIKRVEFYWVNRDQQAFEWFIDLLADLEKKCPFLEINLYFTGNLQADQVRAIMMDDGKAVSKQDAITGLNARTTFGRPDFDSIFATKAQQYQGQTVGVFFCGPPAISKTLYEMCGKYTAVSSKTRFEYHKENF